MFKGDLIIKGGKFNYQRREKRVMRETWSSKEWKREQWEKTWLSKERKREQWGIFDYENALSLSITCTNHPAGTSKSLSLFKIIASFAWL